MPLPTPKQSLRPVLVVLAALTPLVAGAAEAPATKTPPPPAAHAAAATPAKDPVVAVVNGKQIRDSDLEAAKQELGQQAARVSYDELLDHLVTESLLEQAARADKLDQDPAVKKSVARLETRVIIQEYVHRVVDKAVNDPAAKAKIEADAKNAPPEEEVKARHILVKTEDEAKEVIAELDKGGDFAKIADAKSVDKGESGGELGYFTKDKMVPEFSAAAFALKKGEYTKTPVKTQFGWHVIQVEDRRAASPPTDGSKTDEIQQEIAKGAFDARLTELKAKAKIEKFNSDGTPLTKDKAAPALEPTP